MTILPSQASNEQSRVMTLLLGLVLAFSGFVQLTVVSRTVVDHPLRADAGEYFAYAWNLSNYGVYSLARPMDGPEKPTPDKVRTPGYPLLLIALGPPEPTESFVRRVTYVQAFLGTASVLLIYLIAASFVSRPFALAAAILSASSPHLVMMSTYVLSETLFCFLLLASTYASIRALRGKQLWAFGFAGLLWGLCSLVRPTMQFLPVLMLVLTIIVPKLGGLRKPAAVAFLSFSAVMAPWLVRNAGLEQAGPSLMLNNIAHGAYPGFMYNDRPETFGFPYRFDPEYPEHVTSAESLLRHLRDRFSSEPGRYASWFLLGKPYFFLSLRDAQSLDIQIYPTPVNPYYERPLFAWMRGLAIQAHWPLMSTGLAGVILALCRTRSSHAPRPETVRASALVALIMMYAIGLHMVAAPFPRYAIPFRPLIFALAMLPLHMAWGLMQQRRLPSQPGIGTPR